MWVNVQIKLKYIFFCAHHASGRHCLYGFIVVGLDGHMLQLVIDWRYVGELFEQFAVMMLKRMEQLFSLADLLFVSVVLMAANRLAVVFAIGRRRTYIVRYAVFGLLFTCYAYERDFRLIQQTAFVQSLQVEFAFSLLSKHFNDDSGL
jgi:hypothetical protein